MISAVDAVISLKPGAQWSWAGTEYAGLNWLDTEQAKPTAEEINAEIERLKALELAKYYQQPRQAEYPPLADLADAMYWQSQGDNTKMLEYIDACNTVKAKYPKDMSVPTAVVQAINAVSLLTIPEEVEEEEPEEVSANPQPVNGVSVDNG
jgi:hypothetical protein